MGSATNKRACPDPSTYFIRSGLKAVEWMETGGVKCATTSKRVRSYTFDCARFARFTQHERKLYFICYKKRLCVYKKIARSYIKATLRSH